jgi:aldehyde dehydrogenase (NAD+)
MANTDLQTNLFINNEYVPSSTGETLTIYNPSIDELVTDKVQVASEQDIDAAVSAAKKAFPQWSTLPGPKRAASMLKFATLLESHASRIAALECAAMGQPITFATAIIRSAAATWRYYAAYAGKIKGESYPPEADGVYKIVEYVPLGVCAGFVRGTVRIYLRRGRWHRRWQQGIPLC